jgi:hypothetical protein
MCKKILKNLLAVTTGLVIAAGLVVMGGNGIPANEVEASDLTLVTDASKVIYGTTTAEDMDLLKKIFDVEYYKAQNPELLERVGSSYKALFEHFCKYGIYEGRTCNANFDPSAYVSAYPDAKKEAGKDVLKAYKHYLEVGLVENRPLTTVEACAKAKVTVRSMIDESIMITPEVFETAAKLGTTDYKAVTKAIEIAKQQAAAGNTVVITTEEISDNDSGSSDASDDSGSSGSLSGYTQVGSLSLGNGLHIYVYKAGGYAAYHLDGDLNMVGMISSTEGYTGDENDPGDNIAQIPVYVFDTAYGEITPAVPAESNFVITGDELSAITPDRSPSVTIVHDASTGEESVADTSGNSSTTYDVGFKFNDASDDSVSFSVGVDGSDGFTLEDTYTIDLN